MFTLELNISFSLQNLCLPTKVVWSIRLLFTLYTCGSIVASIIVNNRKVWMTQLTNWTLIMDAVYFVSSTVYSGIHLFKTKYEEEQDAPPYQKQMEMSPKEKQLEECRVEANAPLSLPAKLIWVFFNFVYDANVVVVMLFWVVLHNEYPFSFMTVSSHGIVFILLLIDYTFHMIPFRILHFVYAWFGAAAFTVFAVTYNFVTKRPVYSILNFVQFPGTAFAYTLACLFIGMIVHISYYFLNQLKMKIIKSVLTSK